MSTSNMSIRIDSDVKAKAQALFSALGIDMTTAINIFLRQAIQHQGIPFKRMSGIHIAIPVFSKGYRPKQGKVAP